MERGNDTTLKKIFKKYNPKIKYKIRPRAPILAIINKMIITI